MALDSHLSEGYISQLVNGRRINPSRRTLTKIAVALNSTYQDMIVLGENILAGQGDTFSKDGKSPISDNHQTWKDKYYKSLEKIEALREELDRIRENRKWSGEERRVQNLPVSDFRAENAGRQADTPLEKTVGSIGNNKKAG